MTNCAQCKSKFGIDEFDRRFYAKFDLPDPKMCPSCRMQRRMMFRNFFNLYHRKCDRTGKQIISMYEETQSFPVYEMHEWWGDKWDGLDYGFDFDPGKTVFEQLKALHLTVPRLNIMNTNCENSEYSNFSFESRNTYLVFGNVGNEDCCYGHIVWQSKDCFDCLYTYGSEQCYECVDCFQCHTLFFSRNCDNCSESRFLVNCLGCRDCFGCVGLKNAEFHIFNKRYTKEEYEKLRSKIVEHMKLSGEWGEFFPVDFSPFAYNAAIVSEYFPLSKEEIEAHGWRWKDIEQGKKHYRGPAVNIPDDIKDASDDIVDKILICQDSGRPYKIIEKELKFYRQHHLPIPRRCPGVRHRERMKLRNPRKLLDRKCAQCEKSFRTTYTPDRPETVYCEECYLKEVYL